MDIDSDTFEISELNQYFIDFLTNNDHVDQDQLNEFLEDILLSNGYSEKQSEVIN